MNDAVATKQKDMSEPMLGALLLLPVALLLLVIVVYPIATLFWTSLHGVDNANPQAGEQWVGFANYARAFDDGKHAVHIAVHVTNHGIELYERDAHVRRV